MRVEPLLAGRGSIRPDTSFPFSGNITVRGTGGVAAPGPGAAAGAGASAASGSMAVASRPSDRTMASDSSWVSGTARATLPGFPASSSVCALSPPGTSHS